MARIFGVVTSLRDRLSEERDETAKVTVDKLYPHVPSLLKYTDHKRALPWAKTTPGVLMFADISGFTALCEKYSSQSIAGIDHLTTTLNRYLGSLVQMILQSEGDVLKFAGDAILAFWPTNTDDVEKTVEKVVSCCLIIQDTCGRYETDIGVTLTVKMGIAFGDTTFSFVGNEEFRHYIESGPAVDDVNLAQAQCAPHQIVLSPGAWQHCRRRHFWFKYMSDQKHVRILSVREEGLDVSPKHEHLIPEMEVPCLQSEETRRDHWVTQNVSTITTSDDDRMKNVQSSTVNKIKLAMKSLGGISNNLRLYVPSPVLNKLDDGQPLEYLSEMRQISVLFVNLSLRHQPHITASMQTLFLVIYKHVHSLQGCLNKIFLFDKGCSFLIIFGLPGSKHEHDRAYAVQCAVSIADVLRDEGAVSQVSIGVTTGTAFCGVVGHKDRHEYSVIGRKVNMAARLMMCYPGEITCDEDTFHGSELPAHAFKVVSPKAMKGVTHTGVLRQVLRRAASTDSVLLHTLKHSEKPILGREKEMNIFQKLLDDNQSHRPDKRGDSQRVLVIAGEAGMGKTRLLDAMTSRAVGQGFRIVSGALSMEDADKPYVLVRIFLRTLLAEENTPLHVNDEDIIKDGLQRNGLLRYLPFVNFLMGNKVLNLPDIVVNSGGFHTDIRCAFNIIVNMILQTSTLTVFAVDDIHFADEDSWNLLLDMQQQQHKAVFVFTTKPPKVQRLPESFQGLLTEKTTQTLCLEGLETKYLYELACQILQVSRIPVDIYRILVEKSFGSPSWCEHVLQDLVSNGQLQIIQTTPNIVSNMVSTPVGSDDILDCGNKEAECAVSVNDLCEYNYGTEFLRICRLNPDVNVTGFKIPASVKDMVIAKLDSLRASEQMLVKCASVLGISFDRQTLIEILPNRVKEARVDVRIGNLMEAGIFVSGHAHASSNIDNIHRSMECGYTRDGIRQGHQCGSLRFQNPMLQDTVYDTLLENQRENLHRKAALHLETLVKEMNIQTNLAFTAAPVSGKGKDRGCDVEKCQWKAENDSHSSKRTVQMLWNKGVEDSTADPSNVSLRTLIPVYNNIAYHWRCARERTNELNSRMQATAVALSLGHTLKADYMLRVAKDVWADINTAGRFPISCTSDQPISVRISRQLTNLENELFYQKREHQKPHDDLVKELRDVGRWYPITQRAETIGLSWRRQTRISRFMYHTCVSQSRLTNRKVVSTEVQEACASAESSEQQTMSRKNSTLLDALTQIPQTQSTKCINENDNGGPDFQADRTHLTSVCRLSSDLTEVESCQPCPERLNLSTPPSSVSPFGPHFTQSNSNGFAGSRIMATAFGRFWFIALQKLSFWKYRLHVFWGILLHFLSRPITAIVRGDP